MEQEWGSEEVKDFYCENFKTLVISKRTLEDRHPSIIGVSKTKTVKVGASLKAVTQIECNSRQNSNIFIELEKGILRFT